MIFSAIAISAIVATTNAAKQYVATFDKSNSGIGGTVTVNDGQVIVDLDLSDEPALPGGFATCTSGGLKWHIHEKWTYGDNVDRMGSVVCGGTYTGGHYDPWAACGGASGNIYCGSDLNSKTCIPTSSYAPSNFLSNPFSAEVGDWSGKYGLLELDSSKKIAGTFSSFYEVTSAEMADLSVVFHCNGGARAFCANFVAGSADVTAVALEQTGSYASVTADFTSVLGNQSEITLYANGDVDIELDVSGQINSAISNCASLKYGIFEAGSVSPSGGAYFGDCGAMNYVGSEYDPTNACLANSGSAYCTNGVLCDKANDSEYTYNCDWANDRYSCAPGDLSGKWGEITDYTNTAKVASYTGDGSLIPLIDDLVGKYVVIQCANDSPLSPMADIACAELTGEMKPTSAPSMSPTATPTKQYVATFANNDISGTVTVNDGQVSVDLDLTAQPSGLPDGYTTCTTGGLKWHIHDKWTYSDNNDRVGADCGGTYTGGHYDPFNACGSASGSAYCGTDANSNQCLNPSMYTPGDFSSNPFAAEIGDWSGKYGLLTLTNDAVSSSFSSFYEVFSAEMQGKSIVFHCNGGARAFCAPFLEGTDEVTPVGLTTGTKTAKADFSSIYSGSEITLYPSGNIDVSLDLTSSASLFSNVNCTQAKYGIFEAGSSALTGAMTSCDNYVGAAYDPTNSCLPGSGSSYCTEGKLCDAADDSAYTYNCDFAADRYSCAPGDLSGKLGLVTDPANVAFAVNHVGDNSLIPPTDDLIGKVMVIQCANAGMPGYNLPDIACAPIVDADATSAPTSNPTEGSPTTAPTKQYVATFDKTKNGIGGTVTVNDGQVMVDLDLSDEPALPNGFATCTSGGLKYHIHAKWEGLGADKEALSSMCGGTYTGGHFDPYNACGSASGSTYCDKSDDVTGSLTASCIPKGAYMPSNFGTNPFAAEIGDWSGKYGILTMADDKTIKRTDQSFYEVMSSEMDGLSVVFHCGDGGERAFCAVFEESTTEVAAYELEQSATGKTVTADFSAALGKESQITLKPNGDVSITLDVTEKFAAAELGCTSLSYGIFEPVDASVLLAFSSSLECDDFVGAAYDPTNSCVDFSASSYCADGVLCDKAKDSAYTYNCDWDSDRYSCAPGDLSGKFGALTDPANTPLTMEYTGDGSFTPLTDDLVGKVMAIYCPYAQSSTAKYMACARINDVDADESGVEGLSFFVAVAMSSVFALLF